MQKPRRRISARNWRLAAECSILGQPIKAVGAALAQRTGRPVSNLLRPPAQIDNRSRPTNVKKYSLIIFGFSGAVLMNLGSATASAGLGRHPRKGERRKGKVNEWQREPARGKCFKSAAWRTSNSDSH